MSTPKYQIVEKIATGGMAEVFVAKTVGFEGFEKLVVIKRIRPEFSGEREFIHMFLDEARLAAKLDHPNIASVFDVGFADGSYFLALEYLRGVDLARLMGAAFEQQLAVPVGVALFTIAQVCGALDFAHNLQDAQGQPLHIVHRDVTPSNIFVTVDGNIKLLDFGIAKAANRLSKTTSHVIKGKLGYLSPEHLGNSEVCPASDVFCTGIVLHELLAGRRLYKREMMPASVRAILDEPAPRLEDSRALPKALCDIVARALEKDPAVRIPTAMALKTAMEAFALEARLLLSSSSVKDFIETVLGNDFFFEESDRHRQLHAKKSGSFFVEESVEPAPEGTDPTRRLGAQPDNPPEASADARTPAIAPQARRARRRRLWLRTLGLLGAASALALAWITWSPSEPNTVASVAPPEAQPSEPARVPQSIPESPKPLIDLAARPRTGTLTLKTEPWAEVYLGRKLIGETPFAYYPLPVGSHRLTLRNPKFLIERSIVVHIRAGENTTRIVTLK